MKKTLMTSAVAGFLLSSIAYAMDVPGPEGVTIELNDTPPHRLVRLRAIGEADIPIGDRKDVERATKVATLKAKAAIAKYMGEDVQTSERVEQISESVQQTNGQVSSVSRNDIEKLVETIHNSSAAFMKGVIVLEQETDPANKRVVVTVGTSEKTMRAADQARKAFSTDSTYRGLDQSIQSADGDAVQSGKEVRRSANFNDF